MNYLGIILKALDKFAQNFLALIPNIIIGFIIAIVTYFISKVMGRIVSSLLPKMSIRANLVIISRKLTIIFVWFIGALVILAIVVPSITTADILTTFGLTSVAIGVTFRNIFENFFTGILLLFREPFSIGDFIEVDSQQGYVHRISVQNTHLRKTDGTRAFIPNSKMFTSTVQILTDTTLRRKKVTCSIDFGTDVEKARTTIRKAVEQCESVSKDKYIQVYVVSFSSNGIDFEIYWWAKPAPSQLRHSLDEVLTSIKKALDEEKIPMTYSTSLSLSEPLTGLLKPND
ncbi:mechanosensitive ion channel family protein [Legionella micdadei]|uniref:Small-conductance mechanosensitive channel n=1 Tax=Legionella micdadei TaxID=451 RepID=A0A098GHT9_LEGMI|nr:mechanosensitive ion channel domain-containing protein [Legionella micdadei]ARG97042.1 mechanosensitive ion channel protein MscS [Legionella micdadei]ARH00703.1 mechanosensitive ion channel protein MscS [Legionella micdadei]KTD26760.1 mechanosensitive ion channel MscS [Legionella micdadei]NSL18264.1 mechanosensitive ion channel [Legionella micdadei]CEG61542.1 Small conductance mechanosensitive ion channel family transporter [Legionella micdadei]